MLQTVASDVYVLQLFESGQVKASQIVVMNSKFFESVAYFAEIHLLQIV